MSMTERSTVIGVFHNRVQAERAILDLKRLGFTDEQIGFVTRHAETGEGNLVADDPMAHTGERVAVGAASGGVVGGLIGAAVSLLIPGFGPAIAGGIIAATLGGAVVGAATGGIVGALTKLGVSEEEARYYQGEFEAGRIIVTVNAPSRQHEALTVLGSQGAYDANTRGATAALPLHDPIDPRY